MSDCKHGYVLIAKDGNRIYKCIYCGDEKKELPKEPVVKEPKKGARKNAVKS